MQMYKNDISIYKGELFSLDFVLVNPDCSPYVFTSKAKNPYILITIASSKYNQYGRYVKNYWLEIPRELLFYNTNCVKLENFDSAPIVDDVGDYDGDMSNYAVYYANVDGEFVYKRWTGQEYVDYSSRIVKTFSATDTSDLTGQSYVYSVSYVDGDDMLEYLRDAYKSEYGIIADISLSKDDLQLELTKKDDSYSKIDTSRCLYSVAISIPIVAPSKLSIINDIDGGAYNGN